MKVRPIRTEEDYHMAMIKVQLLESTPQSKDSADELEVMQILIEKYERDNAPMGMPDPIDSIKIYNQYFSDEKEE